MIVVILSMANVEARMKVDGKHYEISVNLDEALKVKNGEGDVTRALEIPQIFYELKKGTKASDDDLEKAFGTTDVYEIAKMIITKGEVQKTQEFRDEQKEKKMNQVVGMIARNATDQNGRPYTEDRIRSLIGEINWNFDSRPVEKQMQEIVDKLKTITPIKIEVKKLRVTVPAQFTGQTYGYLQEYKESEEWLSNGNLKIVVNVPAGVVMDFYDKLNSMTHGAVQSEEVS